MEYRGFIIEEQFIYCDPFTKVPNGLVDGIWYHEDDETAHGIYRQTISDVKREIDDYIAERLEYRVHRFIPGKSNTITKFWFLSDAIEFCKKVGEDVGNIKTLFKGEEIQFDSI